jgi:tetratricopeptide (TPR) repeat protein
VTKRVTGDYASALDCYGAAAESFENAGARILAATTRNNIGALFLFLNQPDIARPYIERAIRECEDEIVLAQFRATEARLLCAEGDYNRAAQVAAESAEFLQLMNETTFAGESLKTLGEIVLAEMKVRAAR